jgi:hypothetical protein
VYRVGGTRVTLDLVIRAFNRGATAEEIVPEKREREEKELLDAHRDEWSPKGLRERLLARRNNP